MLVIEHGEDAEKLKKEALEIIESLIEEGQINSLIKIPGDNTPSTPLDLVIFFDSKDDVRLNNPLLRELEQNIINSGGMVVYGTPRGIMSALQGIASNIASMVIIKLSEVAMPSAEEINSAFYTVAEMMNRMSLLENEERYDYSNNLLRVLTLREVSRQLLNNTNALLENPNSVVTDSSAELRNPSSLVTDPSPEEGTNWVRNYCVIS